MLRRARGPGPRRVLRPHHAGGVRRERAAHRAVPVRPAPRVRGRVDRRDAGGGRRARLRARGTHQGTHRHHQRPGRQAARRVHAQPGRRRGGPVPRGDGGGRARVHGARGPHHQLERVRAEPRQGRARRRPAAHVPAALLRRHHVHPARGHPARRARGPRSHGGMAHREAGQPPRREGALHRAAEGREGRARGHGRDEREAHADALQGAHELRRQAHQRRASAAGERPCPGRAAAAHRVLRHLHHPRLLHGGLHGGVHERQARQEPVPPLQDKDAAGRGERLPEHAGGHEPPLRARAHGRRALRQQARPRHPRRRQAAAYRGARHVRRDGRRRHRDVRPGKARRGAVRALAGHGPRRAAQRLGFALPGEAGARRGAPLRHHVPPRAARQGHDGLHPGRRRGHGPRAQEGAAFALQVVSEPEIRHARGDQGGARRARGGGRGALPRAAAV